MSDLIRPLSEACYWASQSFQGKGSIRRRLTMLSKIQRWKPEQIRAFQLKKPQRLVSHCCTLEALIAVQPHLISGYSTALHLLTQHALERGTQLTRLGAAQSTAEPIAASMRSKLATGFGGDVFDKYGGRESRTVITELIRQHSACEHLSDLTDASTATGMFRRGVCAGPCRRASSQI